MRRRLGIAAALGVLALPAGADAAPGMLEIEGTFAYVEVKNAGGDVVVRRRPAKRQVRMLRHVPAGVYRVSANRRAARCSRRVHVYSKGLTEVKVSAHPPRRCSMSRRALHARFPARSRIRAVERYLKARGAVNSWALIDSWGRTHGFAPHRTYVSASLVKAMLLTSYLRGIGNRMPDGSERSALGAMITVSSNDAADTIYYRVGDAALYRLAKVVGMKSFSVAGYWANAHFSAEDQARLFDRIDRLIPRRSRAYARGLLSSITSSQRWGFSSFAGAAGFRTFFKGGWRGTGIGQLVHEAALFERGKTRFSMAVLTDGNPSHEYGTETLQGVASRIFARPGHSSAAGPEPELGGTPATRRAGLVDVHKYAPSIRVRLSTGPVARSCMGAQFSQLERFGFTSYLNEWWHFEHRIRPDRYLDVTLGCGRHN